MASGGGFGRGRRMPINADSSSLIGANGGLQNMRLNDNNATHGGGFQSRADRNADISATFGTQLAVIDRLQNASSGGGPNRFSASQSGGGAFGSSNRANFGDNSNTIANGFGQSRSDVGDAFNSSSRSAGGAFSFNRDSNSRAGGGGGFERNANSGGSGFGNTDRRSGGGGGFGSSDRGAGAFGSGDRGGFENNSRGGGFGFGGGTNSNGSGAFGGFGAQGNMNFTRPDPEGSANIMRPRFVPAEKTYDELYSEDRTIEKGAEFDRMFGSNSAEVIVDGVEPAGYLRSFAEGNYCAAIMRNLERVNYNELTPIQRYAIPLIKRGDDVMAHAQTGSGKTAAFILPIIDWIYRNRDNAPQIDSSPYAIMISPTRELTQQLYEEVKKFINGTGITVAKAYGQYATFANRDEIRRGCDILVSTTGRLLDFVDKGYVKLDKVKYLVLDEGDKLLDGNFRDDIIRLCENPSMPSTQNRQTLLFSATYPDEVQAAAKKLMKTRYAWVHIGRVGDANQCVEQRFEQVDRHAKRGKLKQILEEDYRNTLNETGQKYIRKTIVFVDTRRQTDAVAIYLTESGIKSVSIHGDRDQSLRSDAYHRFNTGDCPVLVATDVCARGIDIKGIEHVINFDMPKDIDTYIHRIGRTARIGHTGKATSFFDDTRDAALANGLIQQLAAAQQPIPSFILNAGGIRDTNNFTSASGGGFEVGGGGGSQFSDADFGGGFS